MGYAVSISDDESEERPYYEKWVSSEDPEQSYRFGSRITQEPNRSNNLAAPHHASSPEQFDSMKDLLSRLKSLERENEELREMTAGETSYTAPPPVPHYTWRTSYYVDPDIYLESPQ